MNIDFVRGPTPIGLSGLVLAIAGLCAAAWVGNTYVTQAQELDAWDKKMHEIKKMSRRASGVIAESPRDSRELQQEARIANTVLHQMSVPWDTLFREIESNTDESVALLSVQPDLQNQMVRITGEAKNLTLLLDYIRRLGTARALSNVYLTGHEVKTQDAQRPVLFSLVAVWTEKR
jgi:hypothetical protein